MKNFVFVLLVTVMALAWSRDKQNQSANDRTSTNVAADNSGRNARIVTERQRPLEISQKTKQIERSLKKSDRRSPLMTGCRRMVRT